MRYNTIKRDPIKNSFIMPNEIFRLGLSEGAIAVYAYLLYCEDRESDTENYRRLALREMKETNGRMEMGDILNNYQQD